MQRRRYCWSYLEGLSPSEHATDKVNIFPLYLMFFHIILYLLADILFIPIVGQEMVGCFILLQVDVAPLTRFFFFFFFLTYIILITIFFLLLCLLLCSLICGSRSWFLIPSIHGFVVLISQVSYVGIWVE